MNVKKLSLKKICRFYDVSVSEAKWIKRKVKKQKTINERDWLYRITEI